MPKAYLTIDDSPSDGTRDLVDFLKENKIPAILFVRGQRMEQNPTAIEYAIQNDIIIGNHSYAHIPAGDMEPQDWADDMELCDHLIEAAYARVDKPRPAKYYRFPYIDRGDGQKTEQIDEASLSETNQTSILQQYLRDQGFKQPFKNMPASYPNNARDCLYTYTARDWMLNDEHRGRHEIKTTDDLIQRAANDKTLQSQEHNHVLLLHDQNGMTKDAIALIQWFLDNSFEFLEFGE